MGDLAVALLIVLGHINGFLSAYIIWAPDTPFKQGLINGITLKFLWGKK